MKKTIVKFSAFILLFIALVFSAVGCRDIMASAKAKSPLTYLVIGIDDAAKNADIIMLVGCVPGENRLSFLQIPRDTYYNYGKGQNKINGVFSHCLNSGLSNKEALRAFSENIEDSFGVDISASFAITIDAFKQFVSSLGGVTVDMPYDYTFTNEKGEGAFTLSEGENLLSADMSETFIRYRRGYALGDLSRINAQKIFLRGMIKTVTNKRFTELAGALFSVRDKLYADCEITDILKMLVKKPGSNKDIACKFATLPGEAVMSENGISYFSVNRKNAREVLSLYFGASEFDKDKLLLNPESRAFYNVYYDENAEYFEYSDKDFDSIKLR